MGILSLSGLSGSGPNLKLDVPMNGSFSGLSGGGQSLRRFSNSSPLGVCDSVLGVLGGLINLPISGGFQGFSSSFNPITFIPGVVSGILKVFQGEVPLSGVSLSIGCFGASGILCVDQLLALLNFGVPIGSLRSSPVGMIVN